MSNYLGRISRSPVLGKHHQIINPSIINQCPLVIFTSLYKVLALTWVRGYFLRPQRHCLFWLMKSLAAN